MKKITIALFLLVAGPVLAGSWVPVAGHPSETFLTVEFADVRHGWAGSWGGGIFHTRDGGASWERQEAGLGYEWVNSLTVLDERRVWACGSEGALLRTEDAGATWQLLHRAEVGLEGIQVLDGGRRLVAVGGSLQTGARALLSTDSGQSWIKAETDCRDLLMEVHFPDDQTGFAVGIRGRVVRSTDGGRSWSNLESGSKDLLYAVHFADPTTGWITGRGGRILATRDGGVTWSVQTEQAGFELDDLHFLDAVTGWAVGGAVDPAQGSIVLATRDAGASWERQEAPRRNWWESVFFLDATHGWVVGNTGAVLKYKP